MRENFKLNILHRRYLRPRQVEWYAADHAPHADKLLSITQCNRIKCCDFVRFQLKELGVPSRSSTGLNRADVGHDQAFGRLAGVSFM